jgi:Ca2+-binding RTX toxin-like protein
VRRRPGRELHGRPGSPFDAGRPLSVATGDFNGDGATRHRGANESPSPNDVSILLGTPPPALSVGDVSHEEGNAGTTDYSFEVTRTGDTSAAASVHYASADGTASASGGDYLPTSGELRFAAGELTKTVHVAVRGDIALEADERFFLRLSDPSGATIADGEGVGTIRNDDLSPNAPCTITGTNGADVLHGSAGDDVICAGNGNDRLYGEGGRDVLVAGNGDDRLEGGDGSDLLLGGNGKDTLIGGAGNDTLRGARARTR